MTNDTAKGAAPPAGNAAPVYDHKWWILTAVGIALFMSATDGSIVNIALPTLLSTFDASFATVQWVVLSYLLGLTVLTLSAGRLADLVGKKRIFFTGLVIFVLSSAMCGLAPSIEALIAFRFVQSVGAAMVLALGVAIVTETWPAAERGKAIGVSGGIMSLGIVAGPALGGVLIEAFSWRAVFLVNLPIGLVALVLVWRFVPPLRPAGRSERFDLAGAALVGGGLLCLALAMTLGQDGGFTAPPVIALTLAAAVLLVAFVFVEARVPYPMLNLGLFGNPHFSLNLLTGLLTFVAIAGVVLLLPFYLELVMGLGQRNVGLLMAVVPVVLGIIAPIAGSLSDRFGTRPVSIIGLALIVSGYLACSTLAADTTPLGFVLRLLPVGLGMATFQSPNNSAIMGAVPAARLGIASGTLSMSRTLGQTMGIALLGAYFVTSLHRYAGAVVAVDEAAPDIIVAALQAQFRFVAGLIGLGLLLALQRWWVERGGSNN